MSKINPVTLAENDALRAQVSELNDQVRALWRSVTEKDHHASFTTQILCELVRRLQLQLESKDPVVVKPEQLDETRDVCMFRLKVEKVPRDDGHFDAHLSLHELTGEEREQWEIAKAKASAGEEPPNLSPEKNSTGLLGPDGQPL